MEIVPGVYLGDVESVAKSELKSVVSLYPTNLENFTEKLEIEIDDLPTENILQHFPTVIEFIDRTRESGVLAHCYAGSSRSVSCIVAYMLGC